MSMKTVVITGSSRGIGYGLANEFLVRGCNVVVNGRSQASVDKAIASLSQVHSSERLVGQAGDVTSPDDHQALWDTAVAKFGKVDIWINNAGVGHPMINVWEIPVEKVHQIVDIDLKGLIFGSQVAIRGMLQQGQGHLYNMEGFGSNGRTRAGISLYGATKSAVRFLSRSLTKETAATPVKVSTLSPGIVITDFITEQYEDDPEGLESAKKVFNTLGDKVETVTPWLVEQVLANEKSGASIEWLTSFKIIKRFATARFNQRDLFS
ncbi:SDR family NAD(P)-dependent oxidoreductase [Candidatus Leptofilum sp.]|uniref:SDR family NAD(P)-dependent oxidoreductase n=1 Tax=Candidatus Leptofilum sp. TaxID=3241576 RepID=UPI003B5C45B5